MRLAGLAVFGLVVAAPGRPTGCNGPDEITVRWSFPEGPGERGVERLGCFGWDIRDAADRGSTAEVVMEPGWSRCAVRGWREDGALRVEGPVVRIDRRQASQVVDLGLPAGPIAGMGAQIRSIGGAVHVERIVPGGPADLAGIGAGDLILGVDGDRTAGMSSPEFVRAATGLPLTPVVVRVRHAGGEIGDHRLLRRRIPANWEALEPWELWEEPTAEAWDEVFWDEVW